MGALFFFLKADNTNGVAVVPVKVGYRYTFNQSGYGLYIEPQAGYNAYGVDANSNIFHGIVLGAGTGYLFQPMGFVQFDLGIRYETVLVSGGSVNYLSLRLAHNFSFRKRGD